MARIAVVLMNLGGPDSLHAVRPFLINLFSDPAIINLPQPLRWILARLIVARRMKAARAIYDHLGGGSPLLANTKAQAQALEGRLGDGYRCFIAMRYWHPMTKETAAAVKAWKPDEIVCLPLYPQYSTTTSASSIAVWKSEAERQHLAGKTRIVAAYPAARGFIDAVVGLTEPMLDEAMRHHRARLLLSAHGLPLKIVDAGDPYPTQIGETARAVIAALDRSDLDWIVCYQSRVGPLTWLGPATDDEIRRAGKDGVAVVVVPISFVSEHSETLVELDHDYRRLAQTCGVPAYYRVPAVGADPRFIAALAELVESTT